MILSVIILLMVGIIAYFHFVQGLFSATISAILAVLSAALAVGYQETVVDNLFKGKMGDEANGITLVLIFIVSYVILRIIFDKAVPGNVRFPSTFDKIGAALMGIVAGCFAAGVFAIAVQSLPFGPAVGEFSSYDLAAAQHVVVPGQQQMVDSVVNDQMKDETMDPQKQRSLLIPVDNLVLGAVNNLSDGGTLAGAIPLYSIHPDYPQELFGDRIGIQVGADHVALNVPGEQQVKLDTLYSVAGLPAADGELKDLRNGDPFKSAVVRPTADEVLLVARLNISHDAADDTDKIFRFSPGSIRLVANEKDYYPIGLMDDFQGEPVLMLQRPDDFLFLDLSAGDAPVDVVFLVKRDDLFGGKPDATKVADGRFISVKRMARVDLSGASVDSGYTPEPTKVLRKTALVEQLKKTPPPALTVAPAVAPSDEQAGGSTAARRRPTAAMTAAPSQAAASQAPPTEAPAPIPGVAAPAPEAAAPAPSGSNAPTVSALIPYKIGVTTSDENAANLAVSGGTVSLKDSRLANVQVNPVATLDKLASGDSQLNELYVPDGSKVVQVPGAGTSTVPQVTDSSGHKFSANGYTALLNGKLLMHFDYDRAMGATSIPPVATAVTYFFVVPTGTHLTGLSLGGQTSTIDLTVQ